MNVYIYNMTFSRRRGWRGMFHSVSARDCSYVLCFVEGSYSTDSRSMLFSGSPVWFCLTTSQTDDQTVYSDMWFGKESGAPARFKT